MEHPRSHLWAVAGLLLAACAGTGVPVTEVADPGGVRAGARDPAYVVLVGLDGFRHDYLSLHETRHLANIAQLGAQADALIPPFPSVTFPGFYTIATGMYPEHHGIVANSFWDRERGARYSLSNRESVQDGWWYGGEPIWVTAETQGLPTAAFFYPGTEAAVGGVRPSTWHIFDGSVPYEDRVNKALEWLGGPEETRPRIVTLYFSAVDVAGHEYGPRAGEVGHAVARIDRVIGVLLDGLERLPHRNQIYVVVVSDHGMAPIDTTEHIADSVDLNGVEPLHFGPNVSFYVRGGLDRALRLRDELNDTLDHGCAYLRHELPQHLHARNARLGDVIVVAEEGAEIRRSSRTVATSKGEHGWSPRVSSMHGLFLAMGPGISPGVRLPAFESVHVYPFLARLLGLTPNPDIDGDPSVLMELQ